MAGQQATTIDFSGYDQPQASMPNADLGFMTFSDKGTRYLGFEEEFVVLCRRLR